ncbi:MAG: response regulator [Hyphomicrobiales bacterium]|nr:response regulator [Hyphomicrobiales bacterium]
MINHTLSGLRILLVEDEPLLALDLEFALVAAGAAVVGPAATLRAARALAREGGLSAAVLDVRLGQEEIDPVASLLHGQGVPFLFHTGHGISRAMAAAWPEAVVIRKPADPVDIVRILAGLVREAESASGR